LENVQAVVAGRIKHVLDLSSSILVYEQIIFYCLIGYCNLSKNLNTFIVYFFEMLFFIHALLLGSTGLLGLGQAVPCSPSHTSMLSTLTATIPPATTTTTIIATPTPPSKDPGTQHQMAGNRLYLEQSSRAGLGLEIFRVSCLWTQLVQLWGLVRHLVRHQGGTSSNAQQTAITNRHGLSQLSLFQANHMQQHFCHTKFPTTPLIWTTALAMHFTPRTRPQPVKGSKLSEV
jgi:hypothetical protein